MPLFGKTSRKAICVVGRPQSAYWGLNEDRKIRVQNTQRPGIAWNSDAHGDKGKRVYKEERALHKHPEPLQK